MEFIVISTIGEIASYCLHNDVNKNDSEDGISPCSSFEMTK